MGPEETYYVLYHVNVSLVEKDILKFCMKKIPLSSNCVYAGIMATS